MAIGVASSLFPATMRYDVATFFRRRHLYVNEALYIKKIILHCHHTFFFLYINMFIPPVLFQPPNQCVTSPLWL